MNIRKLIRKIHLWLGLPSSIIVFIICLSGSLFVFSDEIINFANRDISKVIPENQQVPVDNMIETVKKAFPNHILLHCVNHKEKDKAVLFVVANKSTGLCYVYVNPYNGQITGKSKLINFFSFTAHFHKQLLLGKTGSWIILIASIIFVIELITGLIMWWPKNKSKKYFGNSLTIKRNAKFLRKMIDLHRVSGLYFIVVMFLLSVTGVVLFFLPKHGIEAHKHGQQIAISDTTRQALPVEAILDTLMKYPDVEVIKTELWNIDKSPEIQCIAGTKVGVITFTGVPYLFNKYTGQNINDAKIINEIKLRNTFRKLHVGDWLGWFGKIVSFFSSLVGAFLALSGCIIWWRKR